MDEVLSSPPSPEKTQTVPLISIKNQNQPNLLTTRSGLFLVMVLSVFAIAPLFHPGYLQTHQGFEPLWNIIDFWANVGNLSWQPHIATTFNPLQDSGLLLYYLAGLAPLPPIIAVKLMMGSSLLLGGLGIYLWLKSWLGNSGALVSALVYIYLPYQLVNVYVRGAWGEVLFWGLLPWAILASTYLVTSPKWLLVPIAAVFWLAMGLSHLGLTFWALLFIFVLLLVVHRPQALLPILSAGAGPVLATLIYLALPPHTLFGVATTTFIDHFLYPFQLISAFWGFGASRSGFNDGLSLQVGLAGLGLSMLTSYLWQKQAGPQVSRTDRRLLFFGSTAVILVLLQFSITTFIWHLPIWPGHTLSNTLTYPWQLLGFIGLCLSVLAGAALWLNPQLTRLPVLSAIVMIIILSVYSYLLPQFIQPDTQTPALPQAEFGHHQLALLNYDFTVKTPGHTVGLESGSITVPLNIYGPPQASDTIIINVTWQPLQIFNDDLKIFIHLIDANQTVLAQFDGQPQAGTYPTSHWIPGESIIDSYPITLPVDAPPGPYQIYIGLYNETTGQRLPVPTDSAGRVLLDVR